MCEHCRELPDLARVDVDGTILSVPPRAYLHHPHVREWATAQAARELRAWFETYGGLLAALDEPDLVTRANLLAGHVEDVADEHKAPDAASGEHASVIRRAVSG